MITIMVAKWTGDMLSHSLYHALLEFKCIPFLGHEPMIIKNDGSVLNLDLFTAQDSMTKPVRTVNMFASVHSICKVSSSDGSEIMTQSRGWRLESFDKS